MLLEHDAIAEAVAYGVPDPRWGESVHATIVPLRGCDIDIAELIAFARAHLAHYKCPRGIDIAEALPRTASGKINRKELRASHCSNR